MYNLLSGKAKSFLNINKISINTIIDYYNDNVTPLLDPTKVYKLNYGDNWCAAFISVVAHKVGADDRFFPYGCNVQLMVEIAVNRSQWSVDSSIGYVDSLIVYDWDLDGMANHIGIVSAVDDKFYHVIEGNFRGSVGVRKVKKDSDFIMGFIRL